MLLFVKRMEHSSRFLEINTVSTGTEARDIIWSFCATIGYNCSPD